MTEEIHFRQCLPEDVEQAIPLIIASGPTSFDYVFTNEKRKAVDFLKHAFVREGGEFSFDNHHAILVNQNIVGIGAAFSGAKAKTFMVKDFLNILRFYKFSALPVMIRGLRTEQIIKLPRKNEVCLGHLAVDEKERSKGYGQKIILFLMEKSDKKESDYFVLDVSEENPQAQKLYERIGFKVHKHILSNCKSSYGYVANHFRMSFKETIIKRSHQ
ncbi:GNAT family N-acetyltransferase [Flavobacteriales bacterium]|nr:GNAT family N-acetyltransferase [Flavobacteriales bacterium]